MGKDEDRYALLAARLDYLMKWTGNSSCWDCSKALTGDDGVKV